VVRVRRGKNNANLLAFGKNEGALLGSMHNRPVELTSGGSGHLDVIFGFDKLEVAGSEYRVWIGKLETNLLDYRT
jgi:hypothetical protein